MTGYYITGNCIPYHMLCKRQRIPKMHSKMDNPEKLKHRRKKKKQKKKSNAVCGGHHYAQTNTNR